MTKALGVENNSSVVIVAIISGLTGRISHAPLFFVVSGAI